MNGKIRIIGGLFRGKILSVPEHASLRPTPNRIRETLFNWLMHDIRHMRCLDAFAGSGALGLEAMSRGAKSVLLLEKETSVFQQLQKTVHAFSKETLHCQHIDFFKFLQHTTDVFDLVFLDPPFQQDLLDACLEQLHARAALSPGGLVYLESDTPLPAASSQWEVVKSAKASSVYFGLYRKLSNHKPLYDA